jgi:hypothetical protein
MTAPAGYRPSVLAVLVAFLVVLAAPLARGDIFILEAGGLIEGEWLNRDEQPLSRYEIRRGDVRMTLPLGQVREAIRQSPVELEYARRAPTVSDTVEAQWELAEWCRKSALPKQREVHLRRIVELDPNHQQARYALGYRFVRGEWTTVADARRRDGYELYRGKWRTPQEIEILESGSRNELAEKEWLRKLRLWRRELDDRDKAKLAHDSILAIKDPIAVQPLGEFFSRERVRSVKALYVDALTGIKSREALQVIVERSLEDPDEEVFHLCLSKLVQLDAPHIADPFVAALKDNNNARVNRAAIALGRLNDKSAISPLIDALITTHRRVINNGPGADATTTTFTNSGALLKKGEGAELQIAHVQNQAVLDALSKLTGVDFGFDQRAWRYWHAQEKIAQEAGRSTLDGRRQ